MLNCLCGIIFVMTSSLVGACPVLYVPANEGIMLVAFDSFFVALKRLCGTSNVARELREMEVICIILSLLHALCTLYLSLSLSRLN